MTVTKVKPSSSKPIGVSFSYKCHKVRWAYRLKYVAARPSIVSTPYELIVLGLQSQPSSNNTRSYHFYRPSNNTKYPWCLMNWPRLYHEQPSLRYHQKGELPQGILHQKLLAAIGEAIAITEIMTTTMPRPILIKRCFPLRNNLVPLNHKQYYRNQKYNSY
jgi:hypothetical protein